MAYYFFAGLFSSGTNNSFGMNRLYSSLGDYNSIKSGNYKKLLSAYYKKASVENDESEDDTKKKPLSVSNDTKEYTETKKTADKLSSAAQEFVDSRNSELYEEENKSELLSKINNFVSAYNSVVKNASASGDRTVSGMAASMISNTKAYEKDLSKIGITINEKDKLEIDTEKFTKADASETKKLLNSNGTFVGDTMKLAAQVGSAATVAASGLSTYRSNGSYSAFGTGGSFDSFW